MSGVQASAALVLAAVALGCGPTLQANGLAAQGASRGNPLGPSYVLIPLPTEDDSLLGRILPELPRPGRSLEETARANPCADALSEPSDSSLSSSYAYAEELDGEVGASAVLGAFGFSANAALATHFVYRIDTSRRRGLVDTAGYDACCRENDCGVGYVSALVFGEGEYATGQATSASASGGVPLLASASGGVRVSLLERRKVRGYLAAVVTITRREPGRELRIGALSQSIEERLLDQNMDQELSLMVNLEKVSILPSVDGDSFQYWVPGRGVVLSENEFARRYREVVGSAELDHLDRRRNWGGLIVTGLLFGGSAACTVGASVAASEDPVWIIGISGCGALTLGTGVTFGYAITSPDASFGSNELDVRDARRFASRYNRDLVKRSVEELRELEEDARIELTPVLTPLSVGLRGRF